MTSLIPSELIWNRFDLTSKEYPASVAVRTPQAALTFAELSSGAIQLSEWLRDRISSRALVAHSLSNSISFAPAFLGLCRNNAIIPMLSPKYRESEVRAIIASLPIEHILTSPSQAAMLAKIIDLREGSVVTCDGACEQLALVSIDRTKFPPTDIDRALLAQAAIIKLTSGSTGVPKGVVLTAKNVLASSKIVCDTLGLNTGDHIVCPVPLFHSYGFDLGLLPVLTAGATLVPSDLFVPRILLRELADPRTKVFLGVPSMYQALVDAAGIVPDLSHIKYLLSCTAPLNPSLIQAFREKFGLSICQHYGSSETGGATIHDPSQVAAHEHAVGRAMSGVTIALVNKSGQHVPAGDDGEVVVSSDAVSPGYIIGAPSDRQVLTGGKYHTSDLGHLSPDGFLTLKGRIDQLVNIGGLKVSPLEVQQVLELHPSVREVAVLGIRDAQGSETLVAVVSLKTLESESVLLEHCRRLLAEYKVPRRITIMADLPRGGTGKIQIRCEDLQV
ncbi:MAG: acyl--CoA ligase [candidate division Zixibacteria bacterium]|nr:acyl--CoA ligase [candidate division Zixibacteria bacterium]